MSEELPNQVVDLLEKFHDSLSAVEETVKAITTVSLEQISSDKELESLEKARLHLIAVYTANSLYWMYLCTKGENPEDYQIKRELDRISRYMQHVKEITDRANTPKLNTQAIKNFVRNALWTPVDVGDAELHDVEEEAYIVDSQQSTNARAASSRRTESTAAVDGAAKTSSSKITGGNNSQRTAATANQRSPRNSSSNTASANKPSTSSKDSGAVDCSKRRRKR